MATTKAAEKEATADAPELKLSNADLLALLRKNNILPQQDDGPKEVRRDDHPEDGGGWAVRSPVREYSGFTAGIRFTNGLGFVDVEAPLSDRIVHMLQYDFGYEVVSLNEKELAEARKQQAMQELNSEPTYSSDMLMRKGVL